MLFGISSSWSDRPYTENSQSGENNFKNSPTNEWENGKIKKINKKKLLGLNSLPFELKQLPYPLHRIIIYKCFVQFFISVSRQTKAIQFILPFLTLLKVYPEDMKKWSWFSSSQNMKSIVSICVDLSKMTFILSRWFGRNTMNIAFFITGDFERW